MVERSQDSRQRSTNLCLDLSLKLQASLNQIELLEAIADHVTAQARSTLKLLKLSIALSIN